MKRRIIIKKAEQCFKKKRKKERGLWRKKMIIRGRGEEEKERKTRKRKEKKKRERERKKKRLVMKNKLPPSVQRRKADDKRTEHLVAPRGVLMNQEEVAWSIHVQLGQLGSNSLAVHHELRDLLEDRSCRRVERQREGTDRQSPCWFCSCFFLLFVYFYFYFYFIFWVEESESWGRTKWAKNPELKIREWTPAFL